MMFYTDTMWTFFVLFRKKVLRGIIVAAVGFFLAQCLQKTPRLDEHLILVADMQSRCCSSNLLNVTGLIHWSEPTQLTMWIFAMNTATSSCRRGWWRRSWCLTGSMKQRSALSYRHCCRESGGTRHWTALGSVLIVIVFKSGMSQLILRIVQIYFCML